MKTIGVIGLGSIGMRHANNLLALGHEVWGFDPDDKRGMELLQNKGCVTGFFHGDQSDVTDRFADMRDQFDGMVIASPSPCHHDHLAIASMAKKPIFVEKPILDREPHPALDLTSVKMVGFNLRWHSCVKKAREWLDAGLIGKPIWANFTLGQYNDRPHYLRDGVILNWSHEIDLAYYLLGHCSVAASSTRLTDGKDDMTDILLTHEKGCRSTVHLDYVTKPEQRSFIIVGTKGKIIVDLVLRKAQLYGDSIASFDMSDTWNDNYIEEMQAFIDRIDGKETVGCTGAEGLEVLKICLEVRKQAGLA